MSVIRRYSTPLCPLALMDLAGFGFTADRRIQTATATPPITIVVREGNKCILVCR
ncbi:MAG: hypothetical protein IJO54_05015 [Oscillospiraceae bacterium]|nr:hypothetical protein [Oscillospiraceae bacterium]